MNSKYKHKRPICSFILMLFFCIAFITSYIFYSNDNKKIFDPTVKTSFDIFAVNNNQSQLLKKGEQNIIAEKIYYQIDSIFEGENLKYEGMITVDYIFKTETGNYNYNLKNTYLEIGAGEKFISDGFILDIPKENGEMIINIKGIGLVSNQEISFIQSASILINNNFIIISDMPQDVTLFHSLSAKAILNNQYAVILSLLLFLASAFYFVLCILDEKRRYIDLPLRSNIILIDKPLNLLKAKVIRVDNHYDLLNIATKRNKEILFYTFSSKLSYYYVIANDITYLYVHSLKAELPKSKAKINKRGVFSTSLYHK